MKTPVLPLVLSLVLPAVLLGACASTPLTPEKYASVTRFEDDKIYVERIEEAVTPDGTLKLAIFGGAAVAFDQKVRYRANWYDRNDHPIKTSVSSWNQIDVDGDGHFEFVVVAPGARAKRYLIEFETN